MSRIKGIRDGLIFLVRGFTFLAARPRLWPWAILPTIVNLILLGVMLGIFIHYYSGLYSWLASHLGIGEIANAAAWWQHLLNWLLAAAGIILKALIVLLTLIMLMLVTYGLSFIVAGPFNDALSERVETAVTGKEPPPFTLRKFISDLWRTIRVESIKAAILIAIPFVLFVVSFIPFVGSIVYIALTFLFGAWDLGFSYSDIPFGRRAAPFRERLAFAKRHRWTLMGLGAGFVVPFFSLIFAAPMVVGGTLLFVDKTELRNND
ncbi:MAG: EI24 domain-containing protein [bacterium]